MPELLAASCFDLKKAWFCKAEYRCVKPSLAEIKLDPSALISQNLRRISC
jgi:hypothetical protein